MYHFCLELLLSLSKGSVFYIAQLSGEVSGRKCGRVFFLLLNARDLYQHIYHLLERLYRDVLLVAVEVVAACREVRARQAFV